jgi:hypothetical protein
MTLWSFSPASQSPWLPELFMLEPGLFLGVLFLGLAVGGMLTGTTLVRFRGVIYRVEDPKMFREAIASYLVLGSFSIGAYVFNLPNNYVISVLLIGTFVYCAYLLIASLIRKKG